MLILLAQNLLHLMAQMNKIQFPYLRILLGKDFLPQVMSIRLYTTHGLWNRIFVGISPVPVVNIEYRNVENILPVDRNE